MESLRAQIGRLESQLSQSNANLQALSSASEVNSALKERFVTENYTLRENVIDAERMIMEIEDLLEDTRLEAQGALRAERKAQEERHDLEEQIDAMQSRLIAYVSKFGELETVAAIDNGLAPDRTIASTVLTVSRANDDVLVEINAGSRDGVQKGWIMTVGQDGTFLGRLQVEQVDINRSIGRVTLEDPTRGLVVPGSSVYAVKGRN
jgi:cell shape-determining protein MreC